MHIIKHGGTYKEIECGSCHASIGYAYRDVEHKIVNDAYNGEVHETVSEFIYCPECGCRIVLLLKIDGVDREVRSNQ